MKRLFKHNESLKIVNGQLVHHNINDMAINPNNENKVYISNYLNGKRVTKKFDLYKKKNNFKRKTSTNSSAKKVDKSKKKEKRNKSGKGNGKGKGKGQGKKSRIQTRKRRVKKPVSLVKNFMNKFF